MAMASPCNGDGTPSWKSFHGAMPSTRRTVVAGLAAALAAPFPGPARAAAVSAPLKVGDIELRVVSDGTLAAPRAFALPQTPPAEVEALYRAHGAEAPPQFVSQTNATLARIGGELILVDAGSGPNFQATAGRLSQNLEAAGINPETIAKVVFTHGHADHLWGALDDFEDAERFPNASYVIPAAEWDFWTDPETLGRLPDWLKGMARGSARVLRKIEPKVERRHPGEAVAPGLTSSTPPGTRRGIWRSWPRAAASGSSSAATRSTIPSSRLPARTGRSAATSTGMPPPRPAGRCSTASPATASRSSASTCPGRASAGSRAKGRATDSSRPSPGSLPTRPRGAHPGGAVLV
jgi:hypothetical protein